MSELYVNVNGTWKQASNYYVNVNGTWKEGNELHAKISSAWKESSASSTYNGTSGIVSTNIVLDLNASNNSSFSGNATTWNDISGNNNDLTLTNGPTFSTDNGGIIVFDGSDDSAISALNQAFFQFGTGDYSYGLWVKLDTQGSSSYAGVLSSGQGGETGSWQIDLYYTSKFRHRFKNSSGVDELATTTLSSFTNTWYYLFVVNDRSEDELKIYVNGVLNATGSSANYGSTSVGVFSSATDTKNVFSVGQNRGHNDFIDGSVAQVHVYKGKALSASEVLQNYLASGGNFFGNIVTTDLVLHLDASNTMSYLGSGTAWNDISGQGNNATLVNTPSFYANHGGYLSFDGSNDHATLPDIDLTGNEITFSIWTYAVSDTTAALIFLGDSTAPHGAGRILNTHLPYSGNYYFDKGHDGSSSNSYDRINGSLANSDWQNAWVNWTFTANASTGSMKIYRNAELYASGTGKTKTFSNSDGDIKNIAKSNTGNHYDGYISQILLYKKELTAAQVLANYNATKSNYVDLITRNLILHLDAGNVGSYTGTGTTWNNLVSSSYNATLYNGVSFSSSDGGSLVFDGTNDYAEITSASGLGNFSGDFTIEFWVKISTHNSYGLVLEHYANGITNGHARWATQQSVNSTQMYLRVDAQFTITTSGGTPIDGKWHHHVVSRVGSTITYYIDAVSRGTATNSSDVGSSGDTLRIGMYNGGGYTTTGSIPQIRIYSGTGLIASEVTQNYNATKSNFLGAISTTDLVFYLDAGKSMSYSGSGTTWSDLSSSSNDGTLTNGPTFDSANGGFIVFDGTNDYVLFSSDLFNPNSDFTISAWINLDSLSGTNSHTIVSNLDTTGSFQLRYKNGTGLQVVKNFVEDVDAFSYSENLATGTWYNITVSRSSNTYTYYLNGSQVSSFTSSITYSSGLKIIGMNRSLTNRFDGKIAQVFAYDEALTANVILSNYNATKSSYHELITTNLVLHLDAGNSSSYSGIGTTWTDLSNQGNNATLTNGPTYSSDNGGAIVFDGSNDYITLGTSINSNISVNKDCSFNIWVQFDIDSRDNVILAHPIIDGYKPLVLWYDKNAGSTPANNGSGDVGGGNTNVLTVLVTNNPAGSTGEYRWTTANNVFGNSVTGTWHNICVVLDTTNDKYYTYLNGQQVALFNSTAVQGINSNNETFNIGRSTDSHGSYLDGKVAQFLVYDVALTANQVLQNYNATKATYGY